MNPNSNTLQIFIQAPDLQSPIQTLTLTLTPNFTINSLKQSILSKFTQTHKTQINSYLTLNGRPLPDSAAVNLAGISNLSTLTLNFRLSGGGGDGGATGAESRDCYLNMYADKKPDKVDPNEQRLSKWLNCALSNEPLKRPIVVDRLGNLFNKQALVEALLGKKLPKAFGYIKGLKDMISVELEPIPGSGLDNLGSDVKFQCPVTGLEFNGKYKFYALKGCGHVLSAKALKEIKSSTCHVCHKEFVEDDKIAINGSEEEVIKLRERMEVEKLKLREKKVKKVKNGDSGVGDEVVKVSGTKHALDLKGKVSGKIEMKVVDGSKVNGKEAKRFKAGDMAPPNANKEVYASIFTSSRKSDFKETYSCRSLPLGRN